MMTDQRSRMLKNPCFCRLSFPKESEEKAKEFNILKRWEKEIFKSSNGKIQDFSALDGIGTGNDHSL